LSNQLEWSTFFLERYLSGEYEPQSVKDHIFITGDISLWTLNQDNVIWQEGIQYFNYGNGISIFLTKKNYTELFCFYAKKHSQFMNEFYISHLDVLKKFIDYFLEQAVDITKQGDGNRLYTPQKYLNMVTQEDQISLDQPDTDKFLLEIDPTYKKLSLHSDKNNLSARELQCIKLCAKGKSAQKIADQLFLSKRTVETHLNNAKAKLNCSNIAELIYVVSHYLPFSKRRKTT